MNYLITGGTGFIGSYLKTRLLREGNTVTVVTRTPEKYHADQAQNQKFIGWDHLKETVEHQDVVIHLAGENLFGKRWTAAVKKSLYQSRIETTRRLADAMIEAVRPPELLVSVSAVGYYGDRGETPLDESSGPGSDFLARLCVDWEHEAQRVQKAGVRVAIPRLGIALHKKGGMLEKMRIPFLFFMGGPVGSGNQYLPWIHLDDLCEAVLHPVGQNFFSGPYNACSPRAVTMNEFSELMGKVMNRPSAIRVPEFILKTVLGEAASPALASIHARPVKLLGDGFEFQFEDLEEALADVL